MAGSGTAHLRDPSTTLLRAEHLTVEFPVGRSGLRVHAVSDVSLDLIEGETLGVVGESGCGKSTTGRAIMQFPPPTAGQVTFDGKVLTDLEGEKLRRVRTELQMIFQDPISSLNPRRKVGDIVAEPLAVWAEATTEERATTSTITAALLFLAAGTLALLGLITLIGGLAGLLGLVDDGVTLGPISVDASSGSSLGALLWTGMLGGAAYSTYAAGRAVWNRDAGARSVAVLTVAGITALALLATAMLSTLILPAIVGVVLVVLMAVLLFSRPSKADFPGVDEVAQRRVDEVLEAVGLDPEVAKDKRPQEFSGGQCQRISIARALILDPQVIICDEPVSALDVSVQAQILNLLEDMKARYGLTLVFIAHDLAVVKNISDRVMVMYLGKTCEVGPPDTLYEAPAHPYTEALLAAIPVPDPSVRPSEDDALAGELPSPVAPPSGCRFRTRCPRAQALCAEEEPIMRPIGEDHFVACHFSLLDEPQEAATPS
jgi:oligopeptide/dipeptide ABC transporter ATP-binding protein